MFLLFLDIACEVLRRIFYPCFKFFEFKVFCVFFLVFVLNTMQLFICLTFLCSQTQSRLCTLYTLEGVIILSSKIINLCVFKFQVGDSIDGLLEELHYIHDQVQHADPIAANAESIREQIADNKVK